MTGPSAPRQRVVQAPSNPQPPGIDLVPAAADPDRAVADGLEVTLPLSIGHVAVRVGSRGEERHA